MRAVEAAGRDVVFVTGRPPRWMGEIAEQTGHTGMAVCGNGALIYDLHTETVAQRFELPAEIGRQAAEAIRAAMPEAAFAVEAANGFGREPGYALRRDRPEARVAALGQLLDGPVVKLLVRHETAAVDELPATARGCSAIWSR
ncbi:MAG: HAD family hydrolase [Egibacteraceae bacterium]